MAKSVGSVFIDMHANSAKLVKEFDKARRVVGRFQNKLNKTFGPAIAQAKTFGAVVGGATVAAVAANTRANIKWAASAQRTADKLGIATDELEGLRLNARLMNIDTKKMDVALQRATRRISEAAAGTGEAKTAFAELGLNAQALNRLPLEKKFGAIVDALGGVEQQSDRVRLAFKIFDTEGVDLVNFTQIGSEGLARVTEQAKQMGLALSAVETKQLEYVGTAIETAKANAEGLGRKITVALGPYIESVANMFTQLVQGSGGFSEAAETAANVALKAFGYIADAVNSIRLGLLALDAAVEAVKSKLNEAKNSKIGQGLLSIIMPGTATNLAKQGPGAAGTGDQYAELDAAMKRLESAVSGGMPSKKLEAEFKKQIELIEKRTTLIKKEQAAAANVAASIVSPFGDASKTEAELTAQREKLEGRLANLRAYYQSEREAINLAYQEKIETLEQLQQSEIEGTFNHAQMKLNIELEHARQLTELLREENQQRAENEAEAQKAITTVREGATRAGMNLLGVLAVRSKKMAIVQVAINKSRAIAEAVQNTAVAVTAHMARMDYAGAARAKILGGLQVAAIAATGFAQASQIAGGDAGLGTLSNPISTTNNVNASDNTGAGGSARVVTVDVRGLDGGTLLSGRDVRALLDSIVEQINEGAGGPLRLALGVGG